MTDSFRKLLFWLHLSIGVAAGLVILIMSITGVLLAYQRQILHWADREFRHASSAPQSTRLAPEALLRNVYAAKHAIPTALTFRSSPDEPVAAEFGRDTVVYLSPETGEILGEGSHTFREFFRETENWHRWLAAGAAWRDSARTLTGVGNLLFLCLLVSGLYLWMPKRWTAQHLRPVVWFRRGLSGRAREWNWHNTIGVWCALPLLVIVGCAVVMSFPWANNLVYRMTGSEVPAANGGGRGGSGRVGTSLVSAPDFSGLDALWTTARQRTPGWQIISLRVPAMPRAPVQFQIDSGDGGRPDLRAQLTLDRRSGHVVRWEPFESNSPGRRLRSWIRFSHTGEAGGIPGETVALIASAGGAVLVYSGLSLAIRRMLRAMARNSSRRVASIPVRETVA